MPANNANRSPADPRHPDHAEFCEAYGKAMLEANNMFGAGFDIMRVHGGVPGADMYKSTFGSLKHSLTELLNKQRSGSSVVPGFEDFLREFSTAIPLRNDIAHGIPTKKGLFRYDEVNGSELLYDTVESLDNLRRKFRRVAMLGDNVAKHDYTQYATWVKRGCS
ncbi:hypothetical protein [Nocardia salmonicida]|uniref:hypothetical protein n=1 Tax=Nocardia salmonicida TaxID=53431 RepID=UPI0033CA72C3